MSAVPLLPPLAASPVDQALGSAEFWLTVGLLVFILVAGGLVLYFTDVWRKRQLAADNEPAESLTDFRAMFERGELTEAEYEAVRYRVAAQMVPPALTPPPSGAQPAHPTDTGPRPQPETGDIAGKPPDAPPG